MAEGGRSLRTITVVWDDAAIKMMPRWDPRIRAAMDLLAGTAVSRMKALCPVSPVYPVYAQPVPLGRSRGQVYGGAGERHKGVRFQSGPERSRRRLPGDLPLPASGTLRSSINAFRMPDESIIIGPTAPYAKYVNNNTVPHVIRSTGPWPLRNRATGQVFGPVVHHPGTRGSHFIERTAETFEGVRVHI